MDPLPGLGSGLSMPIYGVEHMYTRRKVIFSFIIHVGTYLVLVIHMYVGKSSIISIDNKAKFLGILRSSLISNNRMDEVQVSY